LVLAVPQNFRGRGLTTLAFPVQHSPVAVPARNLEREKEMESNALILAVQAAFSAYVEGIVQKQTEALVARVEALEAKLASLAPSFELFDDSLKYAALVDKVGTLEAKLEQVGREAATDYTFLAGELDVTEIASRLTRTQLKDIAQFVSPTDLLEHVDFADVLDYRSIAGEIDLSDLAGEFSVSDIAGELDVTQAVRDFFSENTVTLSV
jgi:hypothetical protein